MKSRHVVFASLALTMLFSFMTPAHHMAASASSNRRLFKNIPRDSRHVHYLAKKFTRSKFRKLKADERLKLQKHLQKKYNLTFKTRSTKYFNIAYRCPEARMNHLQRYLVKFFQQVYPRYFIYEPTHVINVIYFANKQSYTKHTKSGAYGYYTSWTKTLTTYAYSGHGTLWHELIHAFVDQNCQSNPQQWFNEGFASFYEMAFLHNGRVSEGYTNWRMPYLKASIQKGSFSHLRDMMKESWMKEDYGYAKARFLFCYLWVNGKMETFVKAYLYDLCPNYRGPRLGKMAIKKMEELTGKNIHTINKEYLAMARKAKKNQKLYRKRI